MRNLIAALTLVAACGDSEDIDRLKRNQTMRHELLDDMNRQARQSVGRDAFVLIGTYDEHLVLNARASDCDLAILNQMVTSLRSYLIIGDFRSVQCVGGIKVTPPWKE